MFFGNKDEKKRKCENCGSKSNENYNFCPSCGNSFIDPEKERKNYGLLGREDADENMLPGENLGFMDKMFNSMINSMMKSINKQFENQFGEMEEANSEIRALPNGIKIKISGPFYQKQKKQQIKNPEVSSEKIKKSSSLPREKAKTNVKRLSDKIIYELSTPGVTSAQDIFISKLEFGYEVKAIGKSKVYVNSIPLNLPIKKYSVSDDKLSLEFVSKDFAGLQNN